MLALGHPALRTSISELDHMFTATDDIYKALTLDDTVDIVNRVSCHLENAMLL